MAAAAVASSSTPRPLRLAPRWALGGAPDHANAPTLRSRRPRLAVSAAAGAEAGGSERFYFNFTGFPFPLGPFLNRRTIRTEAVKGSIWLFEQEQALGFSSVSTNIRMTVIRLKSGGLWVHAPIAPTKECIQLLKELDAPVEHIVLPTFAYEHKIFVGPFSRKFPRARIWVAPRQWSWPINLPLEFFGIFRAKPLEDEDDTTPWATEIEQKVLSSPEVGIGPYVEVAFYHKPSKTLLVTDAVIFVPRQPPECISKESLLASAKNGLAVKLLSKGKEVPDEPVVDNALNRQKGWERMVLQILFLGPSNLLEPNASFAQMSQKLIVSPIVKTLVFSKVPEKLFFSISHHATRRPRLLHRLPIWPSFSAHRRRRSCRFAVSLVATALPLPGLPAPNNFSSKVGGEAMAVDSGRSLLYSYFTIAHVSVTGISPISGMNGLI